jgi:succinate-semialdehyde dehydrogenase/glutarate-semialdehyde dehydrogenase
MPEIVLLLAVVVARASRGDKENDGENSICQPAGDREIGPMPLLTINPSTGRCIGRHAVFAPAEIERSLARASRAQAAWRRVSIPQRVQHLRSLARELRSHRDALAALAAAEMGKPVAQGRAELEKCALLCDYLVAHGPGLLARESPVAAPREAHVEFEPLGVILAIMPWNFPFWQVIRAVVPAMVAGNAALLKHAPNVSGCALALVRIFRRAGIPRGVFQVLLMGTEPVAGLLADPRIAGVTLTGSTGAGRAVAAMAGAALKPGVFELGGSDPAIVLADADLALAAEVCAASRLFNSGESCVCAKRFIVVRSVLREFEARFTARMAARKVGDPADPATEVGPLARADLRDKLHAQVRQSLRRGARLLLGGSPLPGPGFFYPPTVLSDVRPGMAVFEEEVFGPVGAIIAVRNEAEAVRVANDTSYGLAATLFTRDRARARTLVPQIEAGCVFVNDFVRSAPELPFGGIKQSGFGRELGPWGVRAFVNVKTVWEA